jgi:uncharacterized Rmd1/YagE family protein
LSDLPWNLSAEAEADEICDSFCGTSAKRCVMNEKWCARVEVSGRPELLWEHPELEQLDLRPEDEFEIEERAAILDRKLEVISRIVETSLELLQKDQCTRVEWYIVILIVVEIILSIFRLFIR